MSAPFSSRLFQWLLPLSIAGIALQVSLSRPPSPRAQPSAAPAATARALIVGGGPDREYNQAGIESNVRYITRLLSPDWRQTILFADGSRRSATVQYEDKTPASTGPSTAGARALSLLFEDGDSGALKYRATKLVRVDGPAQRAPLEGAFSRLRDELTASPQPLLMYFTGHGGPSQDGSNEENTTYDLWGNGRPLTVRQLARLIRPLPAHVPITLVMVQCFSGGFGNVLFEEGNPKGALVDRPLAGFFATTPFRMSAGCTPSTNEAEYQDFTSYFFAALSGYDRTGRNIAANADYNRDGRVGMNEAFAWSLIADASIDVPTCTSDTFLRHFVKNDEEEVMRTPWPQLLSWAAPAQKAALTGLSGALKLSGDGRLLAAYQEMEKAYGGDTGEKGDSARRYAEARRRLRKALIAQWPALAPSKGPGYTSAKGKAVAWLNDPARQDDLNALFEAADAAGGAEDGPGYTMRQTRLMRFARLGKSVVLAHRLLADGDPELLARWRRLLAAESRSPFDAAKPGQPAPPKPPPSPGA